MKKSLHVFYILITSAIIASFVVFYDRIHSYGFSSLQDSVPGKISMDKVVFLDGSFSMEEYSAIADRIKKLDNSVSLFVSQVFNIKINDYLENIEPAAIAAAKEGYRNFSIKLAEAQNVIPVVFLSRTQEAPNQVDASSFKYFDASSLPDFSMPEYVYARVMSKKIWASVSGVGFYEEYLYYPYRIPVLFNYKGAVLLNAAVEAVRKYYKLTKNRISVENSMLKIGDIISVPLLSDGSIMVHKFKGRPQSYSYGKFLDAADAELNDKIIIVRSTNISGPATLSLGVAVASIMQGAFIKYSVAGNYAAAAALFLVFFFSYRSLKFRFGFPLFLASLAGLYFGSAALMAQNIFADFTVFVLADLLAFFSFYYYSILSRAADRKKRSRELLKVMHPKAVKAFIAKNRDIRVKNIWAPAYVIYVTFEEPAAIDPEKIKITFEKVRDLIYNKTREFIIKRHNNSDLAVVIFQDSADLKKAVGAALDLRDKITDLKFNMAFNISDVFVFSQSGETGFIDKEYPKAAAAGGVEKKKYIIVSEADIQKFVNVAKFQKISEKSGVVLFNIAGMREEAVDEN